MSITLVLGIFLIPSLPLVLAAALVYAARRCTRTPRGGHAWASAFAILGCQLMVVGILCLSVPPLVYALIWSIPPIGVEDLDTLRPSPGERIFMVWGSGPLVAGVGLRWAAWLFRRRARLDERKPSALGEADVFL